MWTKFEPKEKESWPEQGAMVEYEVNQERGFGLFTIDDEGDVTFGTFYPENHEILYWKTLISASDFRAFRDDKAEFRKMG